MPDLGNNAIFSQTDASNASGTQPSWAEGMAPSTVNDAARALQGALKRFRDYRGYILTSAGTAAIQTLTYNVAPDLQANDEFGFIAGFACPGAHTLNINGLGAKAVKKLVSGAVTDPASGDWTAGDRVRVIYDGTYLVVIGLAAFNGGAIANDLIISYASGAGGGPTIVTQNTKVGAVGDFAMQFWAYLKNASGTLKNFGIIRNLATNVTAGAEAGTWEIWNSVAGTVTKVLNIGAGIFASGLGDPGIANLNFNNYLVSGAAMNAAGGLAKLDGSALVPVANLPNPVRAWVNFYWSGSAVVINASSNITSVVRNGANDYTLTVTNAMPSAYYSLVAGGSDTAAGTGFYAARVLASGGLNAPTLKTTTQVRVGTVSDPANNSLTIVLIGG